MANEFDATVTFKHMPALVAVAMVQQCDHDLTRVTYFRTVAVVRNGEMMRRPDMPVSRCLRHALLDMLGVHYEDIAGSWAERLINVLNRGRIGITDISLYEDGDPPCPHCRKIP